MVELNQEIAHDADSAELQQLLKGIQGNILRGHGRNIAFHLFVRFMKSADVIRETLIPLARRVAKSAWVQLEQVRAYEASDGATSKELFGSVLLSATGYGALGFEGRGPFDQSEHRHFCDGMRSDFSRAKLGDPVAAGWDPPFSEKVDLLVILGCDDEKTLTDEVNAVKGELEKIGVVQEVRGDALWRDDGSPPDVAPRHRQRPMEPFGFVDGISQPLFFDKDVQKVSRAEWNPVAPLGLVLTQDPCVRGSAYGSFYVFRKLEQNVAGFRLREQALAKALNVAAEDVGAAVVGRFRNGTPLHLSSKSDPALGQANDFLYGVSQVCPLHSHARKANPRREGAKADGGAARPPSTSTDRGRRIARRGIPYDHRPDGQRDNPLPSKGVGLLFACYQANIDLQFAFIQRNWLNDPHFAAQDCGEDPLVSHGEGGGDQFWKNGQGKTEPHRFGRYVTMKGGEFFFAPSMAFLSKLSPD